MYAVVRIGGSDYKVKPGDRITVPDLPRDKKEELEFAEVKLLSDDKGLKLSPRAVLRAKVLAQRRGKKKVVYKFKRRKGYRRKLNHRDTLTDLEVISIDVKK